MDSSSLIAVVPSLQGIALATFQHQTLIKADYVLLPALKLMDKCRMARKLVGEAASLLGPCPNIEVDFFWGEDGVSSDMSTSEAKYFMGMMTLTTAIAAVEDAAVNLWSLEEEAVNALDVHCMRTKAVNVLAPQELKSYQQAISIIRECTVRSRKVATTALDELADALCLGLFSVGRGVGEARYYQINQL